MDFAKDAQDFRRLPEWYRQILIYIFTFFAKADNLVMDNLASFSEHLKRPELVLWLAKQKSNEGDHVVAYHAIIQKLFNAEELLGLKETLASEHNAITKLIAWVKRMMTADYRLRILAYLMVEGMGFPIQFVPLFLLRNTGLLNTTVRINRYVARDENLHKEVWMRILLELIEGISDQEYMTVLEGFLEAMLTFVDGATAFPPVTAGLHPDMLMMSRESYRDFVKYQARKFTIELGKRPLPEWPISHPYIDFLEANTLPTRTSFFEKTPINYTETASLSTANGQNWGGSEVIF